MNFPIFFQLVAFRELVKLSQTKHIISKNLKILVYQSLWGEPYKNVEILPVPQILKKQKSKFLAIYKDFIIIEGFTAHWPIYL